MWGAIGGPLLLGVVPEGALEYAYILNSISFLAVLLALFLMGDVPQNINKAGGINFSAMWEGIQIHFQTSADLFNNAHGLHRHILCVCKYHAPHSGARYFGCRQNWIRLVNLRSGDGFCQRRTGGFTIAKNP